MRKLLLGSALLGLSLAVAPLVAQNAAPGGAMTANEVGAQPMTGTSAANYAAWAADSDLYEIQSSRLALSRTKSDSVKQLAREMIDDHNQTTQSLMAALPKASQPIPKPPKTLSQPNADKVAQLRDASAADFDRLYLQQQQTAHQQAWALHKGYATDGSDPALKQVATNAVPIIEKHLRHLKGASSGNM